MTHPDKAKDEFAQLVIARLREAGVTGEISYDPEEFEISVAGKVASILFLGNAYREYLLLFQKAPPQLSFNDSCGAGWMPTSQYRRSMPTFSPTFSRRCGPAASLSQPA